MNKTGHRLRRWQVWLCWVIWLLALAWIISGLALAIRSSAGMGGEALLNGASALPSDFALAAPAIGPRPVASLRLEARSDGPKWLIAYADGGTRLADARTGALLPPLAAADAARIVETRYTGGARIASVDRTAPEAPSPDFRPNVAAWRVTMSDGTRFYLDAATGEMLASRTRWWRVFDVMQQIHVIDLGTREDAPGPLLIGVALVTLAGLAMASVLLVRRL
jgi:hypothetical protein